MISCSVSISSPSGILLLSFTAVALLSDSRPQSPSNLGNNHCMMQKADGMRAGLIQPHPSPLEGLRHSCHYNCHSSFKASEQFRVAQGFWPTGRQFVSLPTIHINPALLCNTTWGKPCLNGPKDHIIQLLHYLSPKCLQRKLTQSSSSSARQGGGGTGPGHPPSAAFHKNNSTVPLSKLICCSKTSFFPFVTWKLF